MSTTMPTQKTAVADAAAFAWGAEHDGWSLGLALGSESVVAGEPLTYRIAVRNHGDQERTITLFHTLDDKFRTQLWGGRAGEPTSFLSAAVEPAVPISSPFGIELTVPAGGVAQRDAAIGFEPSAQGRVTLEIRYLSKSLELVSGAAAVAITAP